MYLTTFEKLEEPGIINGIVETEKFTLVDGHLDTIDNYYDNEKDENLLYSTYKYIINIAIKGNFILQLTEKTIEDLAIKIKEIRRYFVHSNKTQKEMVIENISNVRNIVRVLIEVLRTRIMVEIGIEKEIIKKYYDNFEEFKNVKENIVIEENDEDEIYDDGLKGRN